MSYDEKPSKTIEEMSKEDSPSGGIRRKACLLMGISGCGKTFSLSTFDPSWKGLFLDFDDKADMLYPLFESGRIDRIDLRLSSENYVANYNKIKNVKLDLLNNIDKYMFSSIDSLTTLYPTLARMSLNILGGKSVTWDHMNWIDGEFWDLLSRLVGTIPYVVLTAHDDIRGDSDATMKVVPLARKALSNSIPGRFKENYHAVTFGGGDEVCYMWHTRPSGIYGGNTLIPDLPFEVPNNFKERLEKW